MKAPPADGAVARQETALKEGSHAASQQRVYDYILTHPGIHLRKISRELNLAIGDVQYHLHRLERSGIIASKRRGIYRFFYPSTLFGEHQSDLLGLLWQETPREILLNLIEIPDLSQEELARVAGLSQPTISWHMKRLVDLGIVERRQRKKSVTYRIACEAGEVAEYIRSYQPTVWERWSSRLADILLAFSAGGDDRG